jgi:hypothetical protein
MSTPQTLTINDSQPSTEIDWLLDTDLSDFFDIDRLLTDLSLKITELSEELCRQI